MRLIDAARFERRLMFTVDRDEICDDCLRNFLNEMAEEPTIDPVKHGRWKQPEECDIDENVFECSSCGDLFILLAGTPRENNYNYCPNCGAKMGDANKSEAIT